MANRRLSLSFILICFLISFFLLITLSKSSSDFEGFEAEEEEEDEQQESPINFQSPPSDLTLSTPISSIDPVDTVGTTHEVESQASDPLDLWDEDEFEGLPTPQNSNSKVESVEEGVVSGENNGTQGPHPTVVVKTRKPQSWVIEIVCGSFLVMFAINFFTGKRQNENLALAWAGKFATKNSIFEKNFSLLGVGSGKDDDSALLLKEGQNVFRFYASGRRFCQGLLATMELKSRHDLISRLYNMVVPCKDEITFEIFMNEDAMDHVVFAMAKKKAAKAMLKEARDLQRFAVLMSTPGGRKWVPEDLGVVAESKEVAGDLITDVVLDQVFGEKAYEKYGKGFISMHFSDHYSGISKKMLVLKFALPDDVKRMDEMTRLVALVPYYIDLIGRYKLSSQARSKTEAARQKVAQEVYKELQYARQEALQRKKAERRKQTEEAEAKLSAEARSKKEAKERARQMKKAMPKVKMTRGS